MARCSVPTENALWSSPASSVLSLPPILEKSYHGIFTKELISHWGSTWGEGEENCVLSRVSTYRRRSEQSRGLGQGVCEGLRWGATSDNRRRDSLMSGGWARDDCLTAYAKKYNTLLPKHVHFQGLRVLGSTGNL